MNFDKRMLYYPALNEFNNQLRKGLFTTENVKKEVRFNSLDIPSGDKDEEVWFWGYVLEKDGVDHLFSSVDRNGKQINIKDYIPFKIKGQTTKVAHKHNVYYQIHGTTKYKFSERKTMSFKELVETLNSLKHTNSQHYLINWFNGLTSYFFRYYCRTATPAGFGKDSTVDILGNLVGGCATIESPTIAKLEERVSLLKWLLVNEVNDLPKGQWQIIQQFLLASGAFKPSITKHSRAFGNVGEVIDLTNSSIGLAFNDIDTYSDPNAYLDFSTNGAVLDRFPAFRLYGRIEEDFSELKNENIKGFVESHFDDYLELIHNLVWYGSHLAEVTHGYSKEKLNLVVGREKTNIYQLLEVIDAYCESQEEFDQFLDIINKALLDYKAMIIYVKVLPNLYDKLEIPKDTSKDFQRLVDCLYYLKSRPKVDTNKVGAVQSIIDKETFLEKNKMIEKFDLKAFKADYTDKSFWGGTNI